MEFTPNSNLYKWKPTDIKLNTITEMAANAEKIDSELKNVNEQLAETVKQISVKDVRFGAKGDGITDDTSAIQSAFEYAKVNGISKVKIPIGTYKITKITIDFNGVTIEGDGIDLTVLNSTLSAGGAFSFGSVSAPLKNIVVKDMTIQGNTSSANQSALRFYGVDTLEVTRVKMNKFGFCGITSFENIFQNVTITQCQFIETVESGMSVRPCNNVIVDGCIFDNIYGNANPPHGVYFRSTPQYGSKNLTVRGCIFRNTPASTIGNAYAVKIVCDNPTTDLPTTDVIVQGNYIENYFAGVWVVGAKRVHIANNRIESMSEIQTQRAAIGCSNLSEDIVIANNNINARNLTNSLNLDGCNRILIVGNVMETEKAIPISLKNINDLTIQNNVIKETLSTGSNNAVIDFDGVCTDFKIKNNTFKISQRGIQQRNTCTITGLVISGNSINPIEGSTPVYAINLAGTIANTIVTNNDLVGAGITTLKTSTQAGNITAYA
jgi:polygalacturonase